MKIGFVCNEYPPAPHGGIGTFVHEIACGLADAGHSVVVVGLGDRPTEVMDRGVRVVSLGRSRPGSRFGWLTDRVRLAAWLRLAVGRGELDVVEVPDFHGMLPFSIGPCPIVVRLHLAATTIAAHRGKRLRRGLRWCEARTLRRHQNWIAVSRHVINLTKETFGLQSSAVQVIHYPIVEPVETQPPPDVLPPRFLLYAGTVSVRKGADAVAAGAVAALREQEDLHLVYMGHVDGVGDRSVAAEIRRQLGGDLERRAIFTGRVSHGAVFAAMKRAEAFVFPSHLESWGLVVGEAMLAGTPVVVPGEPPFDEYVTDGVTGLFARTSDELSECLVRVCRDQAMRAEMGARAHRWVAENQSLQLCCDRTLGYYRNVVGSGASEAA